MRPAVETSCSCWRRCRCWRWMWAGQSSTRRRSERRSKCGAASAGLWSKHVSQKLRRTDSSGSVSAKQLGSIRTAEKKRCVQKCHPQTVFGLFNSSLLSPLFRSLLSVSAVSLLHSSKSWTESSAPSPQPSYASQDPRLPPLPLMDS